jgi:outer membrane protein TolC
MRFAIPLLVAALFVAFPSRQAGAQAATLTLDQAVSLARRNNPVFQATVNARRAADLNVKAAYANLLPSLSASASGRFTEGGQQFINGIPISNSSDIIQSNYGFGLGYTINSAILFAPRLFAAQRDAAEAASLVPRRSCAQR